MKKVVVILDYPRVEYVKNGMACYGKTQEGRHLKSALASCGLRENINYQFAFLYRQIPKPKQISKRGVIQSYDNPPKAELKQSEDMLIAGLNKYKPDLIIPTGTLSSKWATGNSITKAQGVASKVTVVSSDKKSRYSCWCLPMFSQRYVELAPNALNRRATTLDLLRQYMKKGSKVFASSKASSYTTIKSVEQFKQLVGMCKVTGELAWDLECNTTNPNLLKAKVLIFSFAWAEGKAAALPLEHMQVYQPKGKTIEDKPNIWSDKQLEELYSIIRNILLAKTVGEVNLPTPKGYKSLPDKHRLSKVGHNIEFDINFLLATNHIKWANNVSDTKVSYWLEVSQDEKTTRKLSALSYGLTGMGGYDDPLEKYKTWLLKVFVQADKILAPRLKENPDAKLTKEDAETLRKQIDWDKAKKDGFYYKGLEEWVINIITVPKINKYKKAKKIVNDIESSYALPKYKKFCYEWIPMQIMGYYAAGDSDACLRIHHRLLSMMLHDKKDPEHKLIYLDLDYYAKVTMALAYAEYSGMRLDSKYAKVLKKAYDEQNKKLLKAIRSYPLVKDIEAKKQKLYELGLAEYTKAPKERNEKLAELRNKYKGKTEFNPKSVRDKGMLLYHEMNYKLPYTREYIKDKAWNSKHTEAEITADDYKSDKLALDYLLDVAKKNKQEQNYELLQLLKEYSKVAILKTSFADKLPKYVSEKDHNVHGKYNPTGTGCVAGNTLVWTEQGLVRIDSLSTNRQAKTFSKSRLNVYSADGTVRPTEFYYSGISSGIKFTLANGQELTTTWKHPLKVNTHYNYNKDRISKANAAEYKKYIRSNKWVRAKDIKEGDYVQVDRKGIFKGRNDIITLPNTSNLYITKHTKSFNVPKKLTEDFSEFLGMFTCKGTYSTNNGSYVFTIACNEQTQDRLLYLVKELFNIKAEVVNNRYKYVCFSSKCVGKYLEEVFKITPRAIEKKIPKLVLESNYKVQRAFIKGMTLHISTKRHEYPEIIFTNNYTVLHALQIMLLNLGITSSIKRKHTLVIYRDSSLAFIRAIGLEDKDNYDYLTSYYKPLSPHNYMHSYKDIVPVDKDTLLVRVAKVEQAPDQAFYDVSVADSHSFIANGIISHNTSRISASEPNMQQVPSHITDVDRFDYKYPIKRLFVSRFKNGKLFNIDYSNLEMRVMGLVTKEESMTNAFLSGHDIHKDNASMAFHVPYEEVTAQQRQNAKKIGFGLIYGIGTQKLSEQIGESVEKAEELTKQFYASKPKVKEFIERTHELVHKQGYVNTIIGFRRDLGNIYSTSRSKVATAERESVNTIIQGTGASLTNMAVYLMNKMFYEKGYKSRMFVTVHDSVGIDCPPEEIPEVPNKCLEIMTHLPFKWLFIDYKGKRIRYPIDADMDIGLNYNDMVSFDWDDYKTFKNGDNYIKYNLELGKISDLKECKKITEKQADSMIKEMEAKKPEYQKAD